MVPFLVVANWFWNRGPLFYTQERVGKDGALFKIYKFRSMVENADVAPNTVLFVMQKGYQLNGRLLRPAMVGVSKQAE